ncbi:MAG: hypothetical protein H7Z75_01600 [Ferruginibacter sp.]|nr:hypothetical protein [Cytophagales bacterium]
MPWPTKKEFGVLIVLLGCAGVCCAQPGYQGKKLSVQANLLFLPAVVNGSYHRAPDWLTFNTTGEVSVDYVLGKRNGLGLSYRRARTSSINEDDQAVVSPDKVFTQSVNVHYRIHKKAFGNLAPLGKYVQFGTGVMFNQAKPKTGAPVPFRTYAVRLGKGRNRILADRLLLSYGWELAYLLPASGGEGIAGATHYYENDAPSAAQYRLWRHSLLNLKVGLGFLAR